MNFVRRFSPLAIIIIMVIVQIIETVVVHVSATRWSIWIYLLILNIAITLIYYHKLKLSIASSRFYS